MLKFENLKFENRFSNFKFKSSTLEVLQQYEKNLYVSSSVSQKVQIYDPAHEILGLLLFFFY